MSTDRALPDNWPMIVAVRLALSPAYLDRLMRRDTRFHETCMDYAECAVAVRQATSQSPADFLRIREYRQLELEIITELEGQLRRIA